MRPFLFDRHVFLNLTGLAVLLLGIAASVVIHHRGESQPFDQTASAGDGNFHDGTLSPRDSKRLSADIERTWGALGNLRNKFSDFGEQLQRPKQMSMMVLGFSLLVAFGCFFAADG